MSILIKGMEMPLRCINCPFETYYHGKNRCLANRGKTIEWEIGHDRGRDCPLVPLPEGHGRLIDADALIKEIDDRSMSDSDWWYEDRIDEMPTIVPAEGGTDDG